MATPLETATEIKSVIDSSNTFPNLKKYSDERYHANLGILLGGVFGSSHSADLIAYMATIMPEEGKFVASVKAKDLGAAVPPMRGDAFYTRPNGEKYFTRDWGRHSDVAVLRKAREEGESVYAEGAPGCGKTSMFEAAYGGQMFTIPGTGDTTIDDFLGGFIKLPDGNWEWVDGPLIQAVETGSVLLVDEIGLIDPKVNSILYPLMDGRDELTVPINPARGTIKVKPGFLVVGATNPKVVGARMSEALLSRFSLHVEVTTDFVLAQQQFGVPRDLVQAAINLNNRLRDNTLTWAPQMRELQQYKKLADMFGEDFAIANLMALAPEDERGTVREVLGKKLGDVAQAARI